MFSGLALWELVWMLAFLAWPLVLAILLLLMAWGLLSRRRFGAALKWGGGVLVTAFGVCVWFTSAEGNWRQPLQLFGVFLVLALLFWGAALIHLWRAR